MQGFDCRLDGRDHDFCASGTVAEFVILVRQLSIGIRRDDDLNAVVVSVVTLGSCTLLMEGATLSGPMRSPDSTEKTCTVVY